MGIYDRDYERGYGNQGWRPEGQGLQLRWPTTAVGWVLLVTLGVYLVELAFGKTETILVNGALTEINTNPFTDLFGLNADWFKRPWEVFTLLTYGLLHAPHDIWHILGNMFTFWLFGRELEQRYGSREFAVFYLASVLIGGLAFSAVETLSGGANSVIGASAGSVAVTILYAFNYPHRTILFMFFLPMPMWVLGCFIVAQDLLRAVGSDSQVAFAAHLGGAAFAFAYYRRRWRLSDRLPHGFKLPSFKRRPNLRVYQDDEPAGPQKAALRVDELLKKVHQGGLDSLSNAERKELERESRRARNRPK